MAARSRPDLQTLVLLRRVRDRIDREYARPLDVESLARGVHLSAGQVSRQFRRTYGESPYAYLMTRRIEHAMTLLRSSEQSVTQVCFAVGFQSLGTFSTRYTELVGVPPSAYFGVNLATQDPDAAFAETQAAGTEIVPEPITQDYGIRDAAVGDPAGNLIRVQELPKGHH